MKLLTMFIEIILVIVLTPLAAVILSVAFIFGGIFIALEDMIHVEDY